MRLRIDTQPIELADLRQVWRQPVMRTRGESAMERIGAGFFYDCAQSVLPSFEP